MTTLDQLIADYGPIPKLDRCRTRSGRTYTFVISKNYVVVFNHAHGWRPRLPRNRRLSPSDESRARARRVVWGKHKK